MRTYAHCMRRWLFFDAFTTQYTHTRNSIVAGVHASKSIISFGPRPLLYTPPTTMPCFFFFTFYSYIQPRQLHPFSSQQSVTSNVNFSLQLYCQTYGQIKLHACQNQVQEYQVIDIKFGNMSNLLGVREY